MKRTITPDTNKAKALIKMAQITLERLNKTNVLEYPSNSLVDYYDIIHKLLEAKTFQKGIKIKGDGAHQELIEYCAKELSLNEQTRQFIHQLREYRNRISYEGFIVKQSFIRNNKRQITAVIHNLFRTANQ